MNKTPFCALMMSFVLLPAFDAHAELVKPPYAACEAAAVDGPPALGEGMKGRWPETPLMQGFACHEKWTKIYGALQWRASEGKPHAVWSSFFSFGPDLKLEIKRVSGEVGALVKAKEGESVTLSWKTKGKVESCEAEGDWNGEKAARGGQEVVSITHDGTASFMLSCVSDRGIKSVASAMATIQKEEGAR